MGGSDTEWEEEKIMVLNVMQSERGDITPKERKIGSHIILESFFKGEGEKFLDGIMVSEPPSIAQIQLSVAFIFFLRQCLVMLPKLASNP